MVAVLLRDLCFWQGLLVHQAPMPSSRCDWVDQDVGITRKVGGLGDCATLFGALQPSGHRQTGLVFEHIQLLPFQRMTLCPNGYSRHSRPSSVRALAVKPEKPGFSSAARGGKSMGAPGVRIMAEPEGENKQLRKELAQMRMERDIVKKRLKGEQTVSRSCGMRADRRILP